MAPSDSSSSKGTPTTHNTDGSLCFKFHPSMENYRPPTIKFENIPTLKGVENYSIWAAAMKHIWRIMMATAIVEEGAQPSDDADDKELIAYETIKNYASAVLIQVVSSEILEKIVEFDHPHSMWTTLSEQYYHTSNYNIIYQLLEYVGINNEYDPNTPMNDFISTLEQRHIRFKEMTKASSTIKDKDQKYRQAWLNLLQFPQLNRDLLLMSIYKDRFELVDGLSSVDHSYV